MVEYAITSRSFVIGMSISHLNTFDALNATLSRIWRRINAVASITSAYGSNCYSRFLFDSRRDREGKKLMAYLFTLVTDKRRQGLLPGHMNPMNMWNVIDTGAPSISRFPSAPTRLNESVLFGRQRSQDVPKRCCGKIAHQSASRGLTGLASYARSAGTHNTMM